MGVANAVLDLVGTPSLVALNGKDLNLGSSTGSVGIVSGSNFDITLAGDANRMFRFLASSDTSLGLQFGDGATSLQTLNISARTSDFADSAQLCLSGGGAAQSVARGATVYIHGNEHTNTGRIILQAGDVAGGTVDFFTGTSAQRFSITASGTLLQDASNGGEVRVERASTPVTQSAATGLTAAGTTISDALQLTSVMNNVTTAAAATGVKLWDSTNTLNGYFVYVRNGGANAVNVYPPNGSGTINGGGAGAAVAVAAGAHAFCAKVAANTWIAFEAAAA